MIKESKPYKKSSKTNKRKKVMVQHETGMLSTSNNAKRFPIVSLPEVITGPILQTYRRFTATSGTASGTLTINDCLNQFMFASTSVLAHCFVSAVRIKKIRALAPITTQGTSVLMSMRPVSSDSNQNSFTSVPETYIDTSASIDVPAYLSLTPSLETPLGSWHLNSATSGNLLVCVLPQGSTIDILFEYILRTAEATAPIYTRVIAAGTAGVTYAATILTNGTPQGVTYI